MKLLIQGNNIAVTAAIDEYVHQKLEKAVKHFESITSKVDVHLSVGKNARMNDKHKAEVTVYANGAVIRAQEGSENLYASIDLVADKIARQLRKYKERLSKHKVPERVKVGANIGANTLEEPMELDLIGDRTAELPSEVLRMKYFAMPSMSIQEAQEQLQLVDHDFYMFRNSATNEINVIYIRNHGGYGVIQPKSNHNENGNGHNGNNHNGNGNGHH
jgi:putative sigma-54 modulation protein